MKILKFIRCELLDRHDAEEYDENRNAQYREMYKGDYGDRYAYCKDCGLGLHGDFHMYGDGIWRRK